MSPHSPKTPPASPSPGMSHSAWLQSQNYQTDYESECSNQSNPIHLMTSIWDRFAARSVCLRAIPYALFAALVSLASRAVRTSENESLRWWSASIKHPLAVQAFGIMFAFLITNRVTRAIGRWWDGLLCVNTMYQKWFDAFSFIMFNIKKEHKIMEINAARTDLSEEDMAWVQKKLERMENFSQKMIHWFTLMNALALGTLKYGESGSLAKIEAKSNRNNFAWLTKQKTNKLRIDKMDVVRNAFTRGRESSGSLMYIGALTPEEEVLMGGVDDKMYLSVQWLLQALVIADAEKVIDIAPPILNRVYMNVQDGVGAYRSAYKLAAVPYPYPITQMMQLLMYAFMTIMPIIIDKFTDSEMLTPILSFLIALSYWGLNRVAKELENPFGSDANDLPLHDFCATFNEHIEQIAVLQVKSELDEVFTFSEMCTGGQLPSKKPAALSSPPVKSPAPASVSKGPAEEEVAETPQNAKVPFGEFKTDERDVPDLPGKASEPMSADVGSKFSEQSSSSKMQIVSTREMLGPTEFVNKSPRPRSAERVLNIMTSEAHVPARPASSAMRTECNSSQLVESEVIEWCDPHRQYKQYLPSDNHFEQGAALSPTQRGASSTSNPVYTPMQVYNYHQNVERSYSEHSHNASVDGRHLQQGLRNEEDGLAQYDVPVGQRIAPGDSVPDGSRRKPPALRQGLQVVTRDPTDFQNQRPELTMPTAPDVHLPMSEDAKENEWAHLFLQKRMHIQASLDCHLRTRQVPASEFPQQAQAVASHDGSSMRSPQSVESQSSQSRWRHSSEELC